MNKQEKIEEIALLTERFSNSKLSVLANYKGLTVAQITKLRRELRGAKASSRVTKNTLAKIVIKEVFKDDNQADLEKLSALFEGPNMLTFAGTDPVGPAKILTKFAKENEKLEIKGAWLDGEFLDKSAVEELSNLPSREETLAKLLSLLNAPATQVVQLLQAPGAQVVRLLAAYKDKLEKQGA